MDDAAALENERVLRQRQRDLDMLLDQDEGIGPSLVMRRIAPASSSTTIGARPSSGSSSRSSAGLVISARAIASICCSPPES